MYPKLIISFVTLSVVLSVLAREDDLTAHFRAIENSSDQQLSKLDEFAHFISRLSKMRQNKKLRPFLDYIMKRSGRKSAPSSKENSSQGSEEVTTKKSEEVEKRTPRLLCHAAKTFYQNHCKRVQRDSVKKHKTTKPSRRDEVVNAPRFCPPGSKVDGATGKCEKIFDPPRG